MENGKFSNEQIVKLLKEVEAAYEVKGEDRFRIRAYQNAAASVEHMSEDLHSLWQEGRIKEVAGIGESLASHLNELFLKGKASHFEAVKKGLPPAMFALLGIPGIGARTALRLAKDLKLKEKDAVNQLYLAAKSGKIRSLEGFGETSEEDILKGLEKERKSENRMLLSQALDLSRRLIDYLLKEPKVLRAEPLGSLRRRVSTVGDVDIAVATNDPAAVVKHFVAYPEAVEVLNEGGVKGRIILLNGRQVDLMTQKPQAFGALLQHFTGSKSHNIHLRELAKSKGLSLSEYGVKGRRGRVEEFADEESFYGRIGLDYIQPELREDGGEIEAAAGHNLPDLVELKDIRGDLQMHTVWSDGNNTAEEMVRAAVKKGYEYVGITDHQLSIETRGEIVVRNEIRKRKNLIDKINYSNKNIRVLNGIELLIRADGELSYPDGLLKEFDYVIGAIHSGFEQNKESVTRRLIKAIENPYITFIAHPTGRLLDKRKGVEADWSAVFNACLRNKKYLEIDALPERLDLPDLLVREAKELGLKFLIDTDAHHVSHMGFMEYGVSVARRGWLTKNDVLNSLPFAKLKEALNLKGW
ncbi:MAG: DNA polymerase/3'-5' exonuclease PolX [Patescibacteria group bacterium]|nr:DNA polymerase/3'-5' exonuclease PolX [Patescibacteria group bacterium]